LADVAIDSLCRGVFAGDCRALSLRSCFPALFEAEQRHRSVLLGMALGAGKGPALDSALIRRARAERWSQWSLRSGMETLPEALLDFTHSHGVELHCHAAPKRLQRTADQRWQIILEDGSIMADHVISAIPAGALADLLPDEARPLAQALRGIQAVSVGVVNLQYDDATLPVTGFGHLVPSFENSSLLGIVYDSVAFPEQNGAKGNSIRLTVMLGGAWFTQSFGDPETVLPATLLHQAQEAVRTQLGVLATPSHSIVMVHKACLPQYTLGHCQRIETITRYLQQEGLPLSLVGASYEGVSVIDCLYSAKMAVARLLGQAC
ncbi:protoporphyrinogen oxidase, partial [Alligator sinensis]|uniref:Protoporphyrinogen oxidase n=1 Tax=Alligator sinensis TaxID=38654 RepID=A0A1U7SM30_ALLSI